MKGRNIFFIILVAVAALMLAGVGAWFSVYGLTKIFPAGWLTFILFGTLEFAKIVVVSFVYRFWKITKKFQKFYLIFATVVLMSITSMGIYGFLTNAFQKTSSAEKISRSEVEVYELKKNRFNENRTYYMTEKEEIDNSISDLRQGLVNNKIQYTDSLGNVLTTTSVNTRKVLQAQLDDAIKRRDDISQKLESVTDSLAYYDKKIFDLESANETSTELGPLRYLGELTGLPMNKVVNWLTLLIIIVFDPLAIMLIIVLNLLLLHSGFDPFEGTKSYEKMEKVKDETVDVTKEPEIRYVEVIKEVPVEVIKEVPIEVSKKDKPREDITQVSAVNKAQFIPKDNK